MKNLIACTVGSITTRVCISTLWSSAIYDFRAITTGPSWEQMKLGIWKPSTASYGFTYGLTTNPETITCGEEYCVFSALYSPNSTLDPGLFHADWIVNLIHACGDIRKYNANFVDLMKIFSSGSMILLPKSGDYLLVYPATRDTLYTLEGENYIIVANSKDYLYQCRRTLKLSAQPRALPPDFVYHIDAHTKEIIAKYPTNISISLLNTN